MTKRNFQALLRGSAETHGHLCPGQVIGVRMGMLGTKLIGLDDPKSPGQIKKMIVYVEIDRCATDAIAYVTGASLGRRSLKFADYGIMAATFLNLETTRAFRILCTEESRDLAPLYAPEIKGTERQQMEAYRRMPDSVLFRIQQVRVDYNEFDLPGPTRSRVICTRCGQMVRDHREILVDGLALCRPCARSAYFKPVRNIPCGERDRVQVHEEGRGREHVHI